jgi:ATP-dependent DNA ligase
MEFRPASEIPSGEWQFEPKWDGFRCLVARDGDSVELTSKSGQPLGRYFPDIIQQCRAVRAKRFVVDGEIIMRSGKASFDDLLERIHPAASRVAALAKTMPTVLMVFDLIVDEKGGSLAELPLKSRRPRLESFARKYFGNAVAGVHTGGGVKLSPATTSRAVALKWLSHPRPAMDGVIAKNLDAPYRPGTREGGIKVKRIRTADCVVGGFRYATKGGVLGSLLLGLYDDKGKLNHIGFTSSFSDAERKALVAKLKPLIKPPGFTGKAPGGPSRWSTRRTEEWEPLQPKLVAEVAFDRVTNDRIRHGARFLRWRPDKSPRSCTMDQLT